MHQLFTTQVYQNKIAFDLKDLQQEIIHLSKVDQQGIAWSKKNYVNGYTSYGSLDQLHHMASTFTMLESKIKKHVDQFLKSLEYAVAKKSLKMNSCWVNIMPAGSQHTSHLHPHSVISGTYYVSIPPRSSCIKFEDPRLGLFMNAPLVKETARTENKRYFVIDPKPGELILFESWLKHEVPRNVSKKPRISVSFNYGWN
ncbi:MAG: hypothetical protein H7061_01355 [Bdellovibrionaceae bacterium]|nr:hypothetical protein [Bdellovibrio sp.]